MCNPGIYCCSRKEIVCIRRFDRCAIRISVFFPGEVEEIMLSHQSYPTVKQEPVITSDDWLFKLQTLSDDNRKHSRSGDGMITTDEDFNRRESDDGSGSKKKPGRKQTMAEPETKRKAQNRAAQRAFRERKENHVKQLEQENETLKSQVELLQSEIVGLRGKPFTFESSMHPPSNGSYNVDSSSNNEDSPDSTYSNTVVNSMGFSNTSGNNTSSMTSPESDGYVQSKQKQHKGSMDSNASVTPALSVTSSTTPTFSDSLGMTPGSDQAFNRDDTAQVFGNLDDTNLKSKGELSDLLKTFPEFGVLPMFANMNKNVAPLKQQEQQQQQQQLPSVTSPPFLQAQTPSATIQDPSLFLNDPIFGAYREVAESTEQIDLFNQLVSFDSAISPASENQGMDVALALKAAKNEVCEARKAEIIDDVWQDIQLKPSDSVINLDDLCSELRTKAVVCFKFLLIYWGSFNSI